MSRSNARHTTYDLKDAGERQRLMIFLKSKTVISDGGCWLWQGRLVPAGYGKVYVNGKQHPVHRLAYLTFIENADAPVVRHRCDVRQCWNPSHLEPGTHRDNAIDCLVRGRHKSGKTSPAPMKARRNVRRKPLPPKCKNGHEYTPENTRTTTHGTRRCLECLRVRSKRWRLKHQQTN